MDFKSYRQHIGHYMDYIKHCGIVDEEKSVCRDVFVSFQVEQFQVEHVELQYELNENEFYFENVRRKVFTQASTSSSYFTYRLDTISCIFVTYANQEFSE